MNIARKTVALTAMAFALAGLVASTASGQTLQVIHEQTGLPCANVSVTGTDVNGGCLVHATSEGSVELRKHVFGIESHITSCNTESHGRVDSGGSGRSLEQVLTNPVGGGSCTRQPCKVSGEASPWTAVGSEGGSSTEMVTLVFCVEVVGGGTDESCEITGSGQGIGSHSGELGDTGVETAAHGISGFRCEIVGHWANEVGGTHDGDSEVSAELLHTT